MGIGTALVLLLSASVAAHAASWEPVTTSKDAKISIDKDSIERREEYRKVWVKWEHAEARVSAGTKVRYRSRRSLEVYNCADQTMGLVQYAFYGEKGEVVDSYVLPTKEIRLAHVVPTSPSEWVLRRVCRTEPSRPAGSNKQP
jgi:hypothetical protein